MNDIAKFKQFLRDNNAAAKFYNNCHMHGSVISVEEDLINTVKHSDSSMLLSCAFGWAKTVEGHDYWCDLNDKWLNQLE